MKNWLEPQVVSPPEPLIAAAGGHPVVAETLYKRGIQSTVEAQQFMYWWHYKPTSPLELPDMDKAVKRLRQAIDKKELICIWGDFDVDGQTSTALLVQALRDLGANIMSYIPLRLSEGHGMHITSLDRVLEGGVKLILTCDTGVDEHEAINHANARGVDVVVTDHHKLPDKLPNAVAVVNPRRTPKDHPLQDLPGVGVAYKLIEALAETVSSEYDTTPLLDLVALGIVADVAVQQADTRYLLQRGLAVLADTSRLGLKVMMELADVNPVDVNEDDIGFRLAPRLNAIGRLGDANPTTELLCTKNLERARILASQLEALNAERQRLSDEVWQGVLAALEREPHLLKHQALVISHPEWHTGVIGIVANRCVERFNRPTLLIATPEGEIARGSARSVGGVDITDAIAENRDLLVNYGGHMMAAGVALETENISDFRRRLSESVGKQLNNEMLDNDLQIDRYMRLSELDMALVKDVAKLAPFGTGNPPLVLATNGVTIKTQRQLGRDAKHLKLTIEDNVGTTKQVIWWNNDDPPVGRFDLAYTVRENTFRGEKEVLIEWLDYRQDETITAIRETKKDLTYIDKRNVPDMVKAYEAVLADEGDDLIVWGEVVTEEFLNAVNRDELEEKPALAVWTAPPDPITWNIIIQKVQPERVYLFGADPDVDTAETFLSRLAGLVRYALRAKGGAVRYSDLAAATAHNETTVRVGLIWLGSQGQIRSVEEKHEYMRVEPGDKRIIEDPETAARLRKLLNEAAAYRAFWRRTETEYL